MYWHIITQVVLFVVLITRTLARAYVEAPLAPYHSLRPLRLLLLPGLEDALDNITDVVSFRVFGLDKKQLFAISADVTRTIRDSLKFVAIFISQALLEELLFFFKCAGCSGVVSTASIVN